MKNDNVKLKINKNPAKLDTKILIFDFLFFNFCRSLRLASSEASRRIGQSLLEMIFSIAILMTVSSAILALTTSNLVGQKESEFQIVANNLAREGVEVTRNIRDANWLAGRDWDEGLIDPLGISHRATAEFDAANNLWRLNFAPTSDVLYFSSNAGYNYAGLGQPTIFKRLLILEDICQVSGAAEEIKFPCLGGEQKIGIKVKAEVNWSERNRNRQVFLEETLYDWK